MLWVLAVEERPYCYYIADKRFAPLDGHAQSMPKQLNQAISFDRRSKTIAVALGLVFRVANHSVLIPMLTLERTADLRTI